MLFVVSAPEFRHAGRRSSIVTLTGAERLSPNLTTITGE